MMVYSFKLTEKVQKFILKESSRKLPNETGGILIGKFDVDCVLIEYVTGPGPLAMHSRWQFMRDGRYSQKVLDEIVIKTGGKYDYIGEWHSHPAKSGPSAKDIAAMSWIANNSKYAVEQPIMGLCTKENRNTWQLSFFLFDGLYLQKLNPRIGIPNGTDRLI